MNVENFEKRAETNMSGLLKLALPVVVSMISVTLMGLVDTLMVGRLGNLELASVGLGAIFVHTIYSFAMGMTGSVSTLVSQYFGAKRFQECRRIWGPGILVALGVGGGSFLFSFYSEYFFRWMNPAEEVQELATLYSSWRLLGGSVVVFNLVVSGFLHGIGDTKSPMWVALIINLANIVLDYFLIFGWGLWGGYGVWGAALATVMANVLGSILYVYLFFSNPFAKKYSPFSWKLWDGEMLKKMFGLGLPTGLQFFFGMLSFLIFSIFVGWMGVASLAANQIILQLDELAFLPAMGIGRGVQILVGQSIGAKVPEEAYQVVKKGYLIAFLFEFVSAFLFLVFSKQIIGAFTSDAEVLQLSSKVLWLAPLWMTADAIFIVSFQALRGAGEVTWPMVVGITNSWLKIPLAYLFGFYFGFGIFGCWLSLTFQILFSALLFWRRFHQRKWQQLEVVAPSWQEAG